jgi:PleD family two-component response regulator
MMKTEFRSRQTNSQKSPKTTRILVVDDEPTVIQMVTRYLGGSGYLLDSATNGQEALQKVHRRAPDVLLLDVSMPVIDGLSVCRNLRQDFRTKGLPIILLTAKISLEDRLKGYKSGADDYVIKPFDLDELKVRIEGALERRRWDQGTHPLTHLPGSPGIEEEVRRLLEKGGPFAFAYIDIDNFKAYNDSYGYDAGDKIIKEVADSLIESAVASNLRMGFPGHVGGDDFVLIAPLEAMKLILPEIADGFDIRRYAHYPPEDRERGTTRCKNRRGEEQEFPLVTLSIAVVSTQTRCITHYARLPEIASELKQYIKSLDHHGKSLIMWDRRTDMPKEAPNA